jgi:hypothetical protein
MGAPGVAEDETGANPIESVVSVNDIEWLYVVVLRTERSTPGATPK